MRTFSTSYGVFTLVSRYPLKPNHNATAMHTTAITEFIDSNAVEFVLAVLAAAGFPFIFVGFSCDFPFAILIILQ